MTGLEVFLLVVLVAVLAYRFGCIIGYKRSSATFTSALTGVPIRTFMDRFRKDGASKDEAEDAPRAGLVFTKPETPQQKPGQYL